MKENHGQRPVSEACSRLLPLTSALALSNTLLVTSLGAVNVSFGGLFPIFGLGVCVKACLSCRWS